MPVLVGGGRTRLPVLWWSQSLPMRDIAACGPKLAVAT